MGRDGFTGDCSRLRVDRQTVRASPDVLGQAIELLPQQRRLFILCRRPDTSLVPGACFACGNATEQGGEVVGDID